MVSVSGRPSTGRLCLCRRLPRLDLSHLQVVTSWMRKIFLLRFRFRLHPHFLLVLVAGLGSSIFFGVDAPDSDEEESSSDDEPDSTLLFRFPFLFLVGFGCPGLRSIIVCSASTVASLTVTLPLAHGPWQRLVL